MGEPIINLPGRGPDSVRFENMDWANNRGQLSWTPAIAANVYVKLDNGNGGGDNIGLGDGILPPVNVNFQPDTQWLRTTVCTTDDWQCSYDDFRLRYAVTLTQATFSSGGRNGIFQQGATVQVNADEPPSGKKFDRWTATGITLTNPTASPVSFAMPANDVTLTATYVAATHQVTVNGGTGSGTYEVGATVTIQAGSPTVGQKFDRWTATGVILSNPTNSNVSFVMPDNAVTLTATYVNEVYSVNVTGGTGSGSHVMGDTVTVTANPPAAGMLFDKWTSTSAGVLFANANAASTTFTMPANAVMATANFVPIPKYPVTVNGGTGGGEYEADDLVTITANPAATGQRFTGWTATGITLSTPNSASTSFLMPPNAVTATAGFEAIPYQVTVSGGTGGGTVTYGDEVTVTADEPAEGYKFDRWQTTGITLADPELPEVTFQMPANNVALTATYWQVEVPRFQVTVNGGSGSGQFPVGEQVTVTANPAEQGWVFDGWVADGVTLPDPLLPETTFAMPSRDVTLTSTYEEMPSEPGPDGSTLTITPESGNGPPSVSILVGGIPAGTRFTVQRFVEGDVWRNVHGATDVESSGSAAPVHDWAIPLGVRVFYRVIVDGKPGARAETRIPTSSLSWIQDAYSPRSGLRVSIRALDPYGYGPDAFRQAAWPQPVSEVLVLGAAYPVASVGVRARQGNVPIEISCDIGEAGRLRDFLFTTGILLIRGAPCVLLQPFAFVVIPDLVETHLGNPHEVAVFTGTAMLVREPDESLAISLWTYDRVLEQIPPGSTYDAVKAATGDITYDDAFANPHLVGGAQTRPATAEPPRGRVRWRARLARRRREG